MGKLETTTTRLDDPARTNPFAPRTHRTRGAASLMRTGVRNAVRTAVLALGWGTVTATALADAGPDDAGARSEYDAGKQDLDEGRACAAAVHFAASFELEANADTRFRWGLALEASGRLQAALSAYLDVEGLAADTPRPGIGARLRARIDGGARLPSATIELAARARAALAARVGFVVLPPSLEAFLRQGLRVDIDGQPVPLDWVGRPFAARAGADIDIALRMGARIVHLQRVRLEATAHFTLPEPPELAARIEGRVEVSGPVGFLRFDGALAAQVRAGLRIEVDGRLVPLDWIGRRLAVRAGADLAVAFRANGRVRFERSVRLEAGGELAIPRPDVDFQLGAGADIALTGPTGALRLDASLAAHVRAGLRIDVDGRAVPLDAIGGSFAVPVGTLSIGFRAGGRLVHEMEVDVAADATVDVPSPDVNFGAALAAAGSPDLTAPEVDAPSTGPSLGVVLGASIGGGAVLVAGLVALVGRLKAKTPDVMLPDAGCGMGGCTPEQQVAFDLQAQQRRLGNWGIGLAVTTAVVVGTVLTIALVLKKRASAALDADAPDLDADASVPGVDVSVDADVNVDAPSIDLGPPTFDLDDLDCPSAELGLGLGGASLTVRF